MYRGGSADTGLNEIPEQPDDIVPRNEVHTEIEISIPLISSARA